MADNGEYTKAQLPLLGVILCCTSIPPEKRTELASIASRMGAEHKFDLTSDVTHLIVGDSDTPKYKFVAKEREDVKCLLPSWIEAVRLSWMEGGETDVEALEKQHKLPTFAGLRICVTGFDELNYRRMLEDLINDNGGEYRGNLTKDITHLIAKESRGNKYTYAGQWGIKTVSIEWMQHSLERGMILNEGSYSLLLPPSERGRNAWLRKAVSTTSLGKRPREGGLTRTNSRKLRRTASARLSSENSGMWSNIVGESVKQEEAQLDKWQDREERSSPQEVNEKPVAILQTSGEQRFHDGRGLATETVTAQPNVTRKGGIFQGRAFILYNFSERKTIVLKRHLVSHDAIILENLSSLPSNDSDKPSDNHFLLVSHETPGAELPPLPDDLQWPTTVTDLWLERCLYKKQVLHPSTHIVNRPFFDSAIEGFKTLTISTTAFHDVDLLHVSKVIPLIGAKFSEELDLNTSVLVCFEVVKSSAKRSAAYECGIPTVTAAWLWDCVVEQKLLSYEDYLTQPIVPKRQAAEHVAYEPPPPERSNKSTELPQEKQSLAPAPIAAMKRTKDTTRSSSSKKRHSSTTSFTDTSFGEDSNTTITPGSPKPPSASTSNPRPHPTPLHEISPNLTPKPSPSPPKPSLQQQPSKPPPTQEDPPSSLGPAISSLLAHHQRAASNASERPPLGRRRRQLLGRAPSNLSNRSFSRASSIDTLNTDGVGTPIEASAHSVRPSQKPKDTKDPLAALKAYAEEAELEERGGEKEMQLTQLGYEDPDVKAWRARVVRKIGGGDGLDEDEGKEGVGRRGEVVRDVRFGKAKGVAGRTRAAGR